MRGLKAGINLSPDASLIVGFKALQASSTGSWVTFHLDDLNKHGVIEHDGSLSRGDVSMGDNHTFDPEIWHTTLSVLRSDPSDSPNSDPHSGSGDYDSRISIEKAAQMRGFRIEQGPKLNPEGFNMSSEDLRFSAIETALYLRVFGRGTEGGAETRWVRVMFGEFLFVRSLLNFLGVDGGGGGGRWMGWEGVCGWKRRGNG